MRTHHWLTAFLSGMMLLTVGWKASAQFPPVQATGNAGYSPIAYDAPAQAGYLPDPAISPFDHVFDETYEQNGIWMRNTHNNTQNRHSFTVEALYGLVKSPAGAKAGHPRVNAATFFFDGDAAINNDQDGPNALNTTWYPTANGRNVFMSRGTSLIGSPEGPGIQLKYRVDTPDGQFLEFSGFGIFDAEAQHSIGRPILRTGPRGRLPDSVFYIQGPGARFTDPIFGPINGPNTDVFAIDHVNRNVVTAFMPGVAVNDGTSDGTIIRADHYLHQFMTTDAYGTGFTWGHASRHQVGSFNVQPTFGARYMRIREHYGARIHDSGLDYEFEDDVDDPLYGTIDPMTVVIVDAPYRQRLDSYTDTHLGGPELGLAYEAGGDGFSVFGETRIGVMAAREKATVTAKGLGQQYVINQNPVAVQFLNLFYDRNAFSSRTIEHSFVTPSFLQSFNTKSKLLSYVPLVRNIKAFREAEFTAGYSILMLFQLSRANETIIWNANTGVDPNGFETVISPQEARRLAPEPKVERSLWFVQSFNLGLNWEF